MNATAESAVTMALICIVLMNQSGEGFFGTMWSGLSLLWTVTACFRLWRE